MLPELCTERDERKPVEKSRLKKRAEFQLTIFYKTVLKPGEVFKR